MNHYQILKNIPPLSGFFGHTDSLGGFMKADRIPGAWPEDMAALQAHRCQLSSGLTMASSAASTPEAIECFRLLAHRLNSMRQKRTLRSLLVTSALAGEGKTTVCLNLAAVLARHSQKVLVIDADLCAPRIADLLGGPSEGLTDILADKLTPANAIWRAEPFGFYVLPVGSAEECDPIALFESPRFGSFVRWAGKQFDWVLVDSPPLQVSADAHALGTLTDGSLIVVRAGSTPQDAYLHAIDELEGLNIVGTVLNRCEEGALQPYRSYYRYYNRKKDSASHAGPKA
jgi:capsular exopolysaccharide synthesis family protein